MKIIHILSKSSFCIYLSFSNSKFLVFCTLLRYFKGVLAGSNACLDCICFHLVHQTAGMHYIHVDTVNVVKT